MHVSMLIYSKKGTEYYIHKKTSCNCSGKIGSCSLSPLSCFSSVECRFQAMCRSVIGCILTNEKRLGPYLKNKTYLDAWHELHTTKC